MNNLSSKDFRGDFIQKGFLTVNDVLEKGGYGSGRHEEGWHKDLIKQGYELHHTNLTNKNGTIGGRLYKHPNGSTVKYDSSNHTLEHKDSRGNTTRTRDVKSSFSN